VTDQIKDPPPTDEELAESARLRDALADSSVKNEDADLLRSIALSHNPHALDEEAHRSIVEPALAKLTTRRNARVIRLRWAFGGAGAALALAAAAILLVGKLEPAPSPDLAAHLLRSRSTQSLFDTPFTAESGASARIDRIAMAREADLRENRFLQWGLR
jgi:hypothetical protein